MKTQGKGEERKRGKRRGWERMREPKAEGRARQSKT